MYEAIVEHKAAVDRAKENGEPIPRIPEYIGSCFLMIARNVAKKGNFYNYPFREDMISDGIENCCMYFHNFDSTKWQNPFSYFTTIIWYAFLRRIQKEKKQLYVKQKVFEHSVTFNEMFDVADQDSGDDISIAFTTSSDKMNDFTTTYEAWMKKKQRKRDRHADTLEHSLEDAHFELEDLIDGTEIESPDTWDDPGLGEASDQSEAP
jgi:hypothetical protein